MYSAGGEKSCVIHGDPVFAKAQKGSGIKDSEKKIK